MEEKTNRFATENTVELYTLPQDVFSTRWLDWQSFDEGPGIFFVPDNQFLGIRAKGLTDASLAVLVDELKSIPSLRFLHLAENRGITNRGLLQLARLPQLACLNISSCDITKDGLAFLPAMMNLVWLDMSYCNRITGEAAKWIQKVPRLQYLNLQGVVKINTGSLKKFEKRGLEIYKG